MRFWEGTASTDPRRQRHRKVSVPNVGDFCGCGAAWPCLQANKYHAERAPCDVCQRVHPSRRERARCQELALLAQHRIIRNLRRQTRWEFVVNDVRVGQYTSDFDYERWNEGTGWRFVVEDSKGVRMRDWPLRKRLMLACHGITVDEV